MRVVNVQFIEEDWFRVIEALKYAQSATIDEKEEDEFAELQDVIESIVHG